MVFQKNFIFKNIDGKRINIFSLKEQKGKKHEEET